MFTPGLPLYRSFLVLKKIKARLIFFFLDLLHENFRLLTWSRWNEKFYALMCTEIIDLMFSFGIVAFLQIKIQKKQDIRVSNFDCKNQLHHFKGFNKENLRIKGVYVNQAIYIHFI